MLQLLNSSFWVLTGKEVCCNLSPKELHFRMPLRFDPFKDNVSLRSISKPVVDFCCIEEDAALKGGFRSRIGVLHGSVFEECFRLSRPRFSSLSVDAIATFKLFFDFRLVGVFPMDVSVKSSSNSRTLFVAVLERRDSFPSG